MKEKMKRIEEYTKAMRELLDRLLEQNPDSENEIYDEIWGSLCCRHEGVLITPILAEN